jgi:hypothetical protein
LSVPAASIRTPDQRLSVFVSSTLQELSSERAPPRNDFGMWGAKDSPGYSEIDWLCAYFRLARKPRDQIRLRSSFRTNHGIPANCAFCSSSVSA